MLYVLAGVLSIALIAVGSYASDLTSPFAFYSTQHLELPSLPPTVAHNDIHHLFSAAVSSCPTTQYAVIFQPGVSSSDYDHEENLLTPFLASPESQTTTNLRILNATGQVDVVGVVNTILMDCLHHGIKKVETLDTGELVVAPLSATTVRESVIYAAMPPLEDGLRKRERQMTLRRHERYVQKLVEDYFGSEDYTLVYVTKAAEEETSIWNEHEVGLGAEVPLVQND
ncbi:hypothetical protein LTR05_004745 [Lithohypha guttulata]|uniref:Protein BIG1 n=1 Tax=Lithohypha guttulata TaxID=1690604 RepID=A0AAN7SZ96_9EURO|nr:hypothetical protein LTR05_004745 [Lithohypha guttulata]